MPALLLCFEAHQPDGKVWAIKVGRHWRNAQRVFVRVPLTTIYRGPNARQPKAYLKGRGRVGWIGSTAVLLP